MQKVGELSDGEVRIAAGTLYGAIENLLKLKFIQPVQSDDSRRNEAAGDDIFSDISSKAECYKKMSNMWLSLAVTYISMVQALMIVIMTL